MILHNITNRSFKRYLVEAVLSGEICFASFVIHLLHYSCRTGQCQRGRRHVGQVECQYRIEHLCPRPAAHAVVGRGRDGNAVTGGAA